MAALNLRRPHTRRRWMFGITTVVLTTAVLLLVAAAGGVLPTGSTFDTSNGNLTPSSPTLHDWNPQNKPDSATNPLGPVETITCGSTIPSTGTNCGLDLTGSQSDNALGQGTKEDDTNVSVVSGSIPNNKDDLSRFYINSEKAPCTASSTVNCSGKAQHQFLYMAWERTKTNGSAHMDFEFNQATVGNLSSPGAKTLTRTAGDLLVDFDFGGSGVPVLALHKWIVGTNTPSTDCEAVSSGTNVNCWSKGVTLTTSCTAAPATPCAEASVNGVDVKDYNSPVPQAGFNTLPGLTTLNQQGGVKEIDPTFGEAGIDLTAANVFPADKCFHLGSAWLKSRSAGSSFNSELKDFIAPIPINISNCGEIKIIKHTDPRGIDQGFGFTSDIPNPALPVTTDSQPFCSADTSPSAFTLNDKSIAISSISAANPAVVTTAAAHGYADGSTVTISGSDAVPSVDGPQTITVIDATHFSIPVAVTTAGTAKGTVVGDSSRNTEDCVNVLSADPTTGNAITYHVTENTPLPTGFVLESLTCTHGANSTGAQDGTNQYQANITVAPGETVTCTYVDKLQQGAIKIVKTNGKGGRLQGATFAIKKGGTAISGSPFTTDSNGEICVDQLAFGSDYTIQETGAPSGYKIDDPNESSAITVDTNAKCSDNPYVGEGPFTYTDTPLSTIEVKFGRVGSQTVTNANIVCNQGNTVVAPNSENNAADSLSITSNTAANPTVITTSTAHNLTTGTKVAISGSSNIPDGIYTVTVLTSTTFSIPVDLSGGSAGSGGTVTPFDDTDEVFGSQTSGGLVPGTYTCTVVIDP